MLWKTSAYGKHLTGPVTGMACLPSQTNLPARGSRPGTYAARELFDEEAAIRKLRKLRGRGGDLLPRREWLLMRNLVQSEPLKVDIPPVGPDDRLNEGRFEKA